MKNKYIAPEISVSEINKVSIMITSNDIEMDMSGLETQDLTY